MDNLFQFSLPTASRELKKILNSLEPYRERIEGEIRFASSLAVHKEDKKEEWGRLINQAIGKVKEGLTQGTDLAAVCREAEKILVPIGRAAKRYTIHYIGHAHLDMNWLWDWPETVDAMYKTFSTMDRLMDEFPNFHLSQSSAVDYATMEEYSPNLFDRIKKRIKEGRWEITASTWVEGDKNMASGEAPDGSRVLTWNGGWYNRRIKTEDAVEVIEHEKKTGMKDYIIVYGIGDHGGGPTRRHLEKIKEFAQWPIFPKVKFSTVQEYFDIAKRYGDNLPVVRDELNFPFPGCYSSQSRIKYANRKMENDLPLTETRQYALALYQEVQAFTTVMQEQALEIIASKVNTEGKGIPIMVFNPCPWERKDLVKITVYEVDPKIWTMH